ncbi:MAG TPA: ribose-5-phosphate isomerase RpiA [Treponemataceae bacterium]|nr:ribose-5-phosphate isomerase RpiA [Treponemataceae bacterium]HPS45137.1 ribose-5-phosphate isomerase RpiA [Treponemataceae bacterium]
MQKTETQALTQADQKILAARHAIDDLIKEGLIHSGMRIGLGTGSTAMPAVTRLAERISDGTLKGIRAVATSFQTTIACEELGIPVYSMNAREIGGALELAIDGADEISPEKKLIKGGGAALLLEKIVAYNAERFVIVADETKAVAHLGTKFALPVEVIPEARTSVTAAIERLGAKVAIRHGIRKAGPVITDNGNIILDCLWQPTPDGKSPVDPEKAEDALNGIVGVVENGFFAKKEPIVYVARANGSVEKR